MLLHIDVITGTLNSSNKLVSATSSSSNSPEEKGYSKNNLCFDF